MILHGLLNTKGEVFHKLNKYIWRKRVIIANTSYGRNQSDGELLIRMGSLLPHTQLMIIFMIFVGNLKDSKVSIMKCHSKRS